MQADSSLERKRLIVVLATIVINVVAVVLFSFVSWSDWRTGLALNLFDNLILIMYAVRFRDRMMGQLMIFGMVVGFVELAADAWLVDVTKTLDYSIGGGPLLWRSPVWMPFAWEIVTVQFGYIGLRLFETWHGAGLLLAGVLGGINIPFYEEMALRIHWWKYGQCRMLMHTPYYIIVGEFLIVLCLALAARCVRNEKGWKTFLAGVVGGVSIFVCYALAFGLTDRLW